MKITSITILLLLWITTALVGQARWRSVPDIGSRTLHKMAYDPVRKKIVLFGGLRNNQWVSENDTWEWAGLAWQRRGPAHSPPIRHGFAMAYSPVNRGIIIYGGYQKVGSLQSVTFLSDTWLWDGQDWRELHPTSNPGPLAESSMATDFARSEVVLFGGGSAGFIQPPSDDTWIWDGSNWIQRFPITKPERRGSAAMIWEKNTKHVHLVGGGWFGAYPLDKVWEWDGMDWILHQVPTGATFPKACFAAATDPIRGGILAYEDSVRNSLIDILWHWDGSAWTKTTPTRRPPSVLRQQIVTHEADLYTLHYGAMLPYGVQTQLKPGEPYPMRQTWAFELNQRDWFLIEDKPWPGGISYTAFYDAPRNRVLRLGVENGITTNTPRLWEYSADDHFTDITPSVMPPRSGIGGPTVSAASIVSHRASGTAVLFGNNDHIYWQKFDPHTWLFDGKTWTKHLYAVRPDERALSHMVYDPGGKRVLLTTHGGPREIWSFTPQAGWKLEVPSTQNPTVGLVAYGDAFDERRGRYVWFGYGGNFGPIQCWEWDGKTWFNQTPKVTPSNDLSGTFEYFPDLGGIVMFGCRLRRDSKLFDTITWLWDGTAWSQLPINDLYLNRRYPINSATYDPENGRILVFFGGVDLVSGYELRVDTLSAVPTLPHLNDTITFTLDVPWQPGKLWAMGLSLTRKQGIPLMPTVGGVFRRLPLDDDWLLRGSIGPWFVGTLNAQGKATATMTIPNDPSLLDLRFHAAALTVDTAGKVASVSNPLDLEIVR